MSTVTGPLDNPPIFMIDLFINKVVGLADTRCFFCIVMMIRFGKKKRVFTVHEIFIHSLRPLRTNCFLMMKESTPRTHEVIDLSNLMYRTPHSIEHK